MLVDSASESDFPIFPHFSCASKHDSHGFLHAFSILRVFYLTISFRNFFWILLMMQCLTTNTAIGQALHLLLI